MSEWKECKLGEVAEIVCGATPSTSIPEYWSDEINWVTAKDISESSGYKIFKTDRKISKLGFQNCSTVLLPIWSTVLIARGATMGKSAMIASPMSLNQTCYALIARTDKIDSFFLFYSVKNLFEYFESIAHGAIFNTVIGSGLRETSIIIPPLSEQRAIASVLSSLDNKIDLLYRQNKTLEAMAETLFRQWFVEKSEEGWEEIAFPDFFDFLEGPGIRNWQYTESGTPFINIRLIDNGEINVSKANFVSNEEANGKYRHFLLQEDDMIVSTSGTLGKSAIIRKYHLPLMLNTSVIRFRPKDGKSYSYVYQYLQSKQFQEHLEATASGSVQANFGPTHLKQMRFTKPPKDLLKIYLLEADAIYNKIKTNYHQICTLEKLRDTLLPKLMSGEVRLAI